MTHYVQAVITILSLVNPMICAAMFTDLEGDDAGRGPLGDATRAALVIFVVLESAALVGVRVLGVFGISLSAFQVAGGIVLVWMGFSMLSGPSRHGGGQRPEGEGTSRLTPLVLFAASPGTITGVIAIAANHSGTSLPVTALVGVAVAVGLTWMLLLAVARMPGRRGGGGLARDITTRFMGLIVLAMGVQFVLAGYEAFTKAA